MTTVLDVTRPKARVAHNCDWCFRVIEPGETYRRARQVDYDHGLHAWKGCAHCDAMAHLIDLWDWCGQPDEGIGHDSFAEYEPASIAEARWLIYFRRKWRRADGSLYPVPERCAS